MKKAIAVVVFLFVVAVSGLFAQTTADEWFKKAAEYFDKGDFNNAITAYSESIKRDSTNLNAYFVRGFAYFQVKNYDAAIADFDTVIKRATDFPDAYICRGDAYGAKGLYHKAIADYRTGFGKGYDPSGFIVDKTNKADMWFCGAMYMEIIVNRFLGKTDVVTKYENWLKTVSDKNKVTRPEIEAFYRDNVRALIASVVDEEFNEISFLMGSPTGGYGAVLTRNPQNGQYKLSYEDAKSVTKELTASSLEALSSEMSKLPAEFSRGSINELRAQAALIPAVALSDAALNEIKTVLTNFYTTPDSTTYARVKEARTVYSSTLLSTKNVRYQEVWSAYEDILSALNAGLSQKVRGDVNASSAVTTLTREQQQRLVELRR